MTSRDFIHKYFGVDDGKQRTCGNIIKDERGNIYSYGWHYPLLFKINGLVFRNVRGYSNSTAKHIAWAYRDDAIDVSVNLYGYYSGPIAGGILLRNITEWLSQEIQSISNVMATKKRHNTRIYKSLMDKLQTLKRDIEIVRAKT